MHLSHDVGSLPLLAAQRVQELAKERELALSKITKWAH